MLRLTSRLDLVAAQCKGTALMAVVLYACSLLVLSALMPPTRNNNADSMKLPRRPYSPAVPPNDQRAKATRRRRG